MRDHEMVGRLVASLCVPQTPSMIVKQPDVSQNLLSTRLGSEPILSKLWVWTHSLITNSWIQVFQKVHLHNTGVSATYLPGLAP